MRILALQGCPRENSKTQTIVEIVLAAAREAGAETEVVELRRLNSLAGCQECYECQDTPEEPGCPIDDDMRHILGKAVMADVILWATPVHCWSPSALLKMAMDRFNCMFKFTEDGQMRSLIAGRRMAAIITSRDKDTGGSDLVAEIFHRMGEFSECTWCGELLTGNAHTPEMIREDADIVARAQGFGRKLVS